LNCDRPRAGLSAALERYVKLVQGGAEAVVEAQVSIDEDEPGRSPRRIAGSRRPG
jgi:hypothetical protein